MDIDGLIFVECLDDVRKPILAKQVLNHVAGILGFVLTGYGL